MSSTPAAPAGSASATPTRPQGHGDQPRDPVTGGRTFIFWLELFYLAGLGALAGLDISGVFDFPKTVGTIPVPVAWFGALGGVVISLAAVVEYTDKDNGVETKSTWDPS